MDISALDMFTIGIGPSSSHTVGPMRAARDFVQNLVYQKALCRVQRLHITLYGSLALTGKGHGTDRAILLGLLSWQPETIDPKDVDGILLKIRQEQTIVLDFSHSIGFYEKTDLIFNKDHRLPLHSNGMTFFAYDSFGRVLHSQTYYSVGGGFIMTEAQMQQPQQQLIHACDVPFAFNTMEQLKTHCKSSAKALIQILYANEYARGPFSSLDTRARAIWSAMRSCTKCGLAQEGLLPGGLNVKRRAAALWRQLQANKGKMGPSEGMEWLSVYALAVNEENAAGGRVVTAPTNGAAGVIPAVMHYLIDHEILPSSQEHEQTVAREFLMIAGAIGALYKAGASISAAEMGCQGEIGVASSMAAGAYCAALGGHYLQIEAAAEIAMEHHLGLTCDPVAGLVQIPCIERNTMGAVKAVTAARLALRGNGEQKVSLDQVIRTMLQTGKDMSDIYKETSLGGLAVNVVEC